MKAVETPVDDIRKNVPVEIAPEERPASLEPPEIVNPGPIKKDKYKSDKQKKTLTAEERNYYDSIGRNNYKKSRFLDATPEQRRVMMSSGSTQGDLFSSSGMSDWTNNNIGTFKQFVERFYR